MGGIHSQPSFELFVPLFGDVVVIHKFLTPPDFEDRAVKRVRLGHNPARSVLAIVGTIVKGLLNFSVSVPRSGNCKSSDHSGMAPRPQHMSGVTERRSRIWAIWMINDLSTYLPDAETIGQVTPEGDDVIGVLPDVLLEDIQD